MGPTDPGPQHWFVVFFYREWSFGKSATVSIRKIAVGMGSIYLTVPMLFS